jgi:hypothetical protein
MPDAEFFTLPCVVSPGLHEGNVECVGHRLNRTEVSLAMPDAKICPLFHMVPSSLHEVLMWNALDTDLTVQMLVLQCLMMISTPFTV